MPNIIKPRIADPKTAVVIALMRFILQFQKVSQAFHNKGSFTGRTSRRVVLALSLGLQPTLKLQHPPVLDAIERVRTACVAAGLLCGLHCLAADDAAAHRDEGFAMVTAGTDVMLLKAALADTIATARGGS